MLVVVFGAGASFDSNPAVPASTGHADRPPLANSLFEMDRAATREAAAAFPRAAPALMAARADVRAGGTIEATLARLQDVSEDDLEARSQLMAVRFYLQRVLTVVPDAWDAHAVRQTTYVSMLDQLRRWQRATGQRLVLVTFNYDLLLERACEVVLGHRFEGMASYLSRPDLHVFKPHGSVDWARPARWDGSGYGDQDAARRAVCDNPDLPVHDDYSQRPATADVIEQAGGTNVAWLPALAIPVERKPDVVMPHSHSAALRADLAQATAVLCVGWRAREQHFLRVLQDALPAGPVPLYAVAETQEPAMEAVHNVWATGRVRQVRLDRRRVLQVRRAGTRPRPARCRSAPPAGRPAGHRPDVDDDARHGHRDRSARAHPRPRRAALRAVRLTWAPQAQPGHRVVAAPVAGGLLIVCPCR